MGVGPVKRKNRYAGSLLSRQYQSRGGPASIIHWLPPALVGKRWMVMWPRGARRTLSASSGGLTTRTGPGPGGTRSAWAGAAQSEEARMASAQRASGVRLVMGFTRSGGRTGLGERAAPEHRSGPGLEAAFRESPRFPRSAAGLRPPIRPRRGPVRRSRILL